MSTFMTFLAFALLGAVSLIGFITVAKEKPWQEFREALHGDDDDAA